MRLSLMSTTESILQARFGPEALITQVGAIWLVHLDQPSAAEIQEREAGEFRYKPISSA